MPAQNGVIRNKARASQIFNFSGLIRRRNITPTDIDGLIDYSGRAFIYFEGKVENNRLQIGQKSALEAVVNSHWKANCPSAALIFWHNIPSDCEVFVHTQFVVGVYCKQQIRCLCGLRIEGSDWWHPQTKAITMLQAVERFEEHFKYLGL
jgi:hypothetical protein